ncbi:MAG: F-box protein [Bdellovibrionota bacterium]
MSLSIFRDFGRTIYKAAVELDGVGYRQNDNEAEESDSTYFSVATTQPEPPQLFKFENLPDDVLQKISKDHLSIKDVMQLRLASKTVRDAIDGSVIKTVLSKETHYLKELSLFTNIVKNSSLQIPQKTPAMKAIVEHFVLDCRQELDKFLTPLLHPSAMQPATSLEEKLAASLEPQNYVLKRTLLLQDDISVLVKTVKALYNFLAKKIPMNPEHQERIGNAMRKNMTFDTRDMIYKLRRALTDQSHGDPKVIVLEVIKNLKAHYNKIKYMGLAQQGESFQNIFSNNLALFKGTVQEIISYRRYLIMDLTFWENKYCNYAPSGEQEDVRYEILSLAQTSLDKMNTFADLTIEVLNVITMIDIFIIENAIKNVVDQ